jgi:hypothetical protein
MPVFIETEYKDGMGRPFSCDLTQSTLDGMKIETDSLELFKIRGLLPHLAAATLFWVDAGPLSLKKTARFWRQ